MKRISFHPVIISLIILSLSFLLLAGCASLNTALSGSNAQFVKGIAQSINNHRDISSSLYSGESTLYSLKTQPLFEPHFRIRNLAVSVDNNDKSIVHYSCTIPGLVGAVFNMVNERNFSLNDEYSAPVTVEGDLKIITTEYGTRKIDISGDDNVFSVFASMRHTNPMVLRDLNGSSKESILNHFLNQETILYARLKDVSPDEYAEKVVEPELDNYLANFKTISAGEKKTADSYNFINKIMNLSWNDPLVYIPIIIIMIAIVVYKVNDGFDFFRTIHDRKELREKWQNQQNASGSPQRKQSQPKKYKKLLQNDRTYDTGWRREAVRALSYPQDRDFLIFLTEEDNEGSVRLEALKKIEDTEAEVFQHTAISDSVPDNRLYAIDHLSYPEHRNILANIAEREQHAGIRERALSKLSFFEDSDIFLNNFKQNASEENKIKAAIIYTQFPQKAENHCRDLCRWIQNGINTDSGNVTLAGWSAAALGRILTADMTPDDIEPNMERFSLAVDRHNQLVEDYRKAKNEIDSYQDLSKTKPLFDPSGQINLLSVPQSLFKHTKDLQEELLSGMGIYMLDNGDKPFAYLIHILRDNQSRIPRFIKQGVIMGLLDWLIANASHPKARELLEMVAAVRADLIRSDNELSFFEVRVPKNCIRDDYARIFEMVLHSANPSIQFCNTKDLLELAEKEVPGCMEMLRNYPLRLIDPVNRGTLGFYRFEPYVHAMWVQYQQPKDTGKVISRYHEVDDRTKPLSSGLNLQLFRDIYSVIPTLFHEYQHFKGDPNEASVFLKTQVFSISFYKRYTSAKASRDAVFARMTEVVGQPPLTEKCEALNELIKQFYGVKVTREKATAHADNRIAELNNAIAQINQQETWDPEIKFPLFTIDEDVINRDLIHDIIIRWDMTPKSITASEFQKIIGR
jgi:hypothetical protein